MSYKYKIDRMNIRRFSLPAPRFILYPLALRHSLCGKAKVRALIEQINRKKWWHSPPQDRAAYKQRGIFLSSSYQECEPYGRPLDEPIKVHLSNPLIDTEENIIKKFFGEESAQMGAYKTLLSHTAKNYLKARFRLDTEMYRAAKKNGYDAIAIVTEKGSKKIRTENKLPRSIELNIFDIKHSSLRNNNA